jgi:predicted transcriptional regulator
MDEHEHRIISELSKKSDASQRHLSKVSELSLGMVNIVLHRLIEKGYMKIKQLDGRKVQYILTPEGFSEKLKRSKQYVKNTVSLISAMKESVKKIITDYRSGGVRKFAVLGRGELLTVIELAVRELGLDDIELSRADDPSHIKSGTEVVFCLNELPRSKNSGMEFVDIMQKIAENVA